MELNLKLGLVIEGLSLLVPAIKSDIRQEVQFAAEAAPRSRLLVDC